MSTLLRVSTAGWRLEIAGRFPALPSFLPIRRDTTVRVVGDASVEVFDSDANSLCQIETDVPMKPVFFENLDYDFYLQSAEGQAELSLPPAAVRRHTLGNLTHHSINFRNEVGFVEAGVVHGGKRTTIRFEVYPLKLDFRTDYVQMRDEVSAIARNLVMTVQAKTFATAAPVAAESPTLAEWLSLLRRYFSKYIAAAQAIARRPHSRLEKLVRDVPADRCRRLDRRAFALQIRRSSSRIVGTSHGVRIPSRVPQREQRLSFDTEENRYVKAVLRKTHRDLLAIYDAESTGDEDADLTSEQKFFQAIKPDVKRMLSELQKVLSSHPFPEVKDTAPVFPASLVLRHDPQYAAFNAAARLLNSGLQVESGLFEIGVKNIALLYEYWCFLRLVSILCHHFDLEQQTFVKLTHLKTTIVLTKGVQAAVTFSQRTTGRKLVLIYNRLFPHLPTVAQQPDNVLQLATERGLLIFDAKYRFSFDAQYQRSFGGVGPQVEDINTMHRYRDAIVAVAPLGVPHGFSRVVKGAVVLFPYHDEASFKDHHFFKSISRVEIGGLPLLPTATKLLRHKLRAELLESGFTVGLERDEGD